MTGSRVTPTPLLASVQVRGARTERLFYTRADTHVSSARYLTPAYRPATLSVLISRTHLESTMYRVHTTHSNARADLVLPIYPSPSIIVCEKVARERKQRASDMRVSETTIIEQRKDDGTWVRVPNRTYVTWSPKVPA